jgi:hypothetical protein
MIALLFSALPNHLVRVARRHKIFFSLSGLFFVGFFLSFSPGREYL